MSDLNLTDAHNQWASRPADQRYQSLPELQAALRARTGTSREVGSIVPASLVPVVGNGGIRVQVPGDSEPATMSHWSFGQVARAAGAPPDYLRKLPAPLAADCLTHGLTRDAFASLTGAGKLLVRDTETGPALAALTSQTYGRIWDHQVADAVAEIQARDTRWHNPLAYDMRTGEPVPSGLYASDRDVFIFMIDGGSLLEAGERAKLNRGFFAWNSETGRTTFGLTTFLFNVVCGNHIVWGASDVRTITIRHSAYAPERFASEAAPQILAYANASAQPELTAVRKAIDYLLPVGAELDAWLTGKGFSKAETRQAIAYAEREEGECRTLWQAVQGLTAYGRDLAFADARVDIQTRAGKLLDIVAE